MFAFIVCIFEHKLHVVRVIFKLGTNSSINLLSQFNIPLKDVSVLAQKYKVEATGQESTVELQIVKDTCIAGYTSMHCDQGKVYSWNNYLLNLLTRLLAEGETLC